MSENGPQGRRSAAAALRRDLGRLLDPERVLCPVPADSPYNADAAGPWRGLRGAADAVALPQSAEEVASVIALCRQSGLPLVPRGGGSGVSGGACPVQGGVVCSLERMRRVIELEPGSWRMTVQAGLSTAHVRRLARESGLLFPPDPGAAEQSQIGGNVATNAGGPHAFKYGSTGHWVTGVEAVLPGGEIVRLGGSCRKDVAAYDLTALMVGSEGTLGVLTEVALRLIPQPASSLALLAFLPDLQRGCEAVLATLGSGIAPSALEMIDGAALREVAGACPGTVPSGADFALLVEVDGGGEETASARAALAEALAGVALAVELHDEPEPLWRWREGVSNAVAAVHGGKVSEDVAVPPERLAELLRGFAAIAQECGLQSCAFGHAGDGNVHATLMLDPSDRRAMAAAERATAGLFELAAALGGSVSGEHGLGSVKRQALALQCPPAALALQRRVRAAFDPGGVMNPGKKLPQRG
jgi:glycolate dehydrogenase FAD-linked subunit